MPLASLWCVVQPVAWFWEQVLQTLNLFLLLGPAVPVCLKCLFACLQVEMLRKFMLGSLIIFGRFYA